MATAGLVRHNDGMPESPAGNAPELSVSELAAALKRTVEDRFGFVRVRGEISNYRGPHSSGHAYFSLKDQNARLDAVVWKGVFGRLRTKPEEGLEVIATGKLTTFPGKSSYQIVIEALEPAGVGALLAQLEERRKRLAAEGLFDAARKQLIPYLPTTIGVVTSPTGAVIRDILHRIRDRFPRDVIVWPVRVQGETAAGEVATAIRGFNALPADGSIRRPDVLIVARGGGSLEDLWAFNEEIVVRAAAESLIPLVSAIGHETDTTLIDHAADLRAPTPTGAAEKVVPVRVDLLAQQTELARRLVHAQARHLDARRSELRALARVLPTPDDILGARRQSLDACATNLRKDMRDLLARRRRQIDDLSGRLAKRSPQAELARRRGEFNAKADRLDRARPSILSRRCEVLAERSRRLQVAMGNRVARGRDRIAETRRTLVTLHDRLAPAFGRLHALRWEKLRTLEKLRESFSYKNVLARGFALVLDEHEAPLRSAAAVAPGQKLVLQFADGRTQATADGEATPRKPARPVKSPSGQGSLF